MDVKNRYLNVPVVLIKGFLNDPRLTIQHIIAYCFFRDIAIRGIYESVEEMEIEFEVNIEGFGLCENSISELGNLLVDSIAEEKPYVGIHIERLIDFHANEFSEFDRVVFMAYLALKSIIQNQSYKRITIEYLFSRMEGNSKKIPLADLSPDISGWASRKKRTKIFTHLEIHYKLIRPFGNIR